MSTSLSSERRFLSRDELSIVEQTHQPKLVELDAAELREAQARLRDLRTKSRTLSRQMRREAKGKAAPRASGDPDHTARRKQIFSQALRRANRQLQRLERAEARARTTAGAQRALALRRRAEAEAETARIDPGRHARVGMRPNPSLRRAMGVEPAKVGSVSKAGKVAQAKRDAAG